MSYLFCIITSPINKFITSRFTSSRYNIDFECFCSGLKRIYYENGILILLDVLAIAIPDLFIRFVKHNKHNILCFSLLCLYTVYMHYIPISFFLLVAVAIVLLFSILYIWRSRDFFKNKSIFWICLALLLITYSMVLYFICDWYILTAFCLLMGSGPDSNPNPGPPNEGPGGGAGGGPPPVDGHPGSSGDPGADGGTDPDADADGDTDYDYVDNNLPASKGKTKRG